MVLPATEEKLRKRCIERKHNPDNVKNKVIWDDVEDHLAEVYKEELIYHRMLDKHRETLANTRDWTIDKGYKAIDRTGVKGKIS